MRLKGVDSLGGGRDWKGVREESKVEYDGSSAGRRLYWVFDRINYVGCD